MSDTPRTDALLESILERRGNVGPNNCPEDWVLLARKLERELAEAKSTAENTRLRAALAKCRSGFPGCARADDLMGCPEIGAALEVDRLKRELDEANHRLHCLQTSPNTKK